ncbi:MAG: methyltransferase domain-containing protein [Pseudomonadota bacterium]
MKAIFDTRRRAQQRERMASRFPQADFLHRRAMAEVVDRLETVLRPFPNALFIGAGETADILSEKAGVGEITLMDLTPSRLPKNARTLIADEERLPFAAGQFDLIVSILTLHGANDVVGALAQARQALSPDGLFLAAIFGEGTLSHWRAALRGAEIAETGALAARIAPFGAIQDFGSAMQRAGFAMPVVDTDSVKVEYARAQSLIDDLRAMGETSLLAGDRTPLTRATAARALAAFNANGGQETFEIVYLTGWAPAPDQPKPLRPGSAKASMADAVKLFDEKTRS